MSKRALLVIDVQKEYISGQFQVEYPPTRDSLPKIARAMDTAQSRGIPVIAVQHLLPSDAPIFAGGSEGAQLHPTVANRHYDHLVTKALPSVFSASPLRPWLETNNIDTLTIAGYMTHNCIDATAREALHRGLKVEILADAVGSLPYKNAAGSATAEEIHRVTLVVMESAYAAVMSTEQWIVRLESPVDAPRDNIFCSNQRAIGKM